MKRPNRIHPGTSSLAFTGIYLNSAGPPFSDGIVGKSALRSMTKRASVKPHPLSIIAFSGICLHPGVIGL